jgi:hypothetical protein
MFDLIASLVVAQVQPQVQCTKGLLGLCIDFQAEYKKIPQETLRHDAIIMGQPNLIPNCSSVDKIYLRSVFAQPIGGQGQFGWWICRDKNGYGVSSEQQFSPSQINPISLQEQAGQIKNFLNNK